MAVTVSLVDANSITTGDTVSTSVSVDPATNELWCAFLVMRTTSITPSIAGTGLSWTEVTSGGLANAQAQMKGWLWRGLSTSDPSSGTITVTITGNTKPAWLVVWKASGVDTSGTNGSGAIDASATNAGPPAVDDDDMLCAITTTSANTVVVGNGSHRAGAFTTPGGQSTLSINNSAGAGGDVTTASVWTLSAPTAGATTIGAANDLNSARDWLVIAVAIKPAGAATYAPPPLKRRVTRQWVLYS